MKKVILFLMMFLLLVGTSCITGKMYPKHKTKAYSAAKHKKSNSYHKNKKQRNNACTAYK